MCDHHAEVSPAPSALHVELRQKIGWICQSIRWLLLAFLAWSAWRIISQSLDAREIVDQIAKTRSVDVTVERFLWSRLPIFLDWFVAGGFVLAVWRLMSGYLAGDIFSAEAAKRLRLVGLAGLVAQIFDMAARPVAFAIESLDMMRGLPWSAYLAPLDLLLIIVAVFILGLARIYGAAAKISDEHLRFV